MTASFPANGRKTATTGAGTHARIATLAAAVAAFGLALPAPAAADPPPWAPAHGYRAKHKDSYVHYRPYYRQDRRQDYRWAPARHAAAPGGGAGFATCNRDLLGAVIGGVAGGAAGTQIGSGSGRTAAIIAGTIMGGVIGGSVGRSMDRTDTQCVGQVLEHVPSGRWVEWRNPDGNAGYRVMPVRTYRAEGGSQAGRYCREYTAAATVGGREEQVYGTACRQPDGSWQIVS